MTQTFSCMVGSTDIVEHKRARPSSLYSDSYYVAESDFFSFHTISINQFSGHAYSWGVAGAAARVSASKHLDPLQQRIDALLGCQGETN